MRDSGYRVIPEEFLDGAIKVLTRWSKVWPERPTWVMPAPAYGVHAEANRVIARHIANMGNRPLAEVFDWVAGPLPQNTPGKPIVDHLDEAIQRKPGVVVPDGPVLLCSAVTQTRWTATVIARLLNDIERGPVLPMALHQLP